MELFFFDYFFFPCPCPTATLAFMAKQSQQRAEAAWLLPPRLRPCSPLPIYPLAGHHQLPAAAPRVTQVSSRVREKGKYSRGGTRGCCWYMSETMLWVSEINHQLPASSPLGCCNTSQTPSCRPLCHQVLATTTAPHFPKLPDKMLQKLFSPCPPKEVQKFCSSHHAQAGAGGSLVPASLGAARTVHDVK